MIRVPARVHVQRAPCSAAPTCKQCWTLSGGSLRRWALTCSNSLGHCRASPARSLARQCHGARVPRSMGD
eukprot:11118626-Alexandrium_andersonii.AAC.1